jgi:hypothetical protein
VGFGNGVAGFDVKKTPVPAPGSSEGPSFLERTKAHKSYRSMSSVGSRGWRADTPDVRCVQKTKALGAFKPSRAFDRPQLPREMKSFRV